MRPPTVPPTEDLDNLLKFTAAAMVPPPPLALGPPPAATARSALPALPFRPRPAHALDAEGTVRPPRQRLGASAAAAGRGCGLMSARDLTASLVAAPSWVHVAQLVHRWHGELNAISLAAALKRLAACCQPQMLNPSRPEGPALLSMLQHLCFQAEYHLPTMRPRELSGVLWALAVLGFSPPLPLAVGLAEGFMASLPEANALDCAQGLWALSQMGWPLERAELEAVWRRTLSCLHPDRPSCRSLLVVLCAATKMGLRLSRDELLWLEAQLVAASPMLSGQDVANALSSLARLMDDSPAAMAAVVAARAGGQEPLGQRDRPPTATLRRQRQRREGAASVRRRGHGDVARGVSGLRPQPETLKALLSRMAPLLSSMRGDEAAAVLYSLARLGFDPGQPMRSALFSRCASQRASSSTRALALMVWAASRLAQQPPSSWTADIMLECLRRLPYFAPSELATLLYGFAVQRGQSTLEPEATAALLAAVTAAMSSFSPQEVANTAWAVAQLPTDCAPTRGSAFWAAMGERCRQLGFGSFTSQGLANVLWGTAALTPNPTAARRKTRLAARYMPAVPALDQLVLLSKALFGRVSTDSLAAASGGPAPWATAPPPAAPHRSGAELRPPEHPRSAAAAWNAAPAVATLLELDAEALDDLHQALHARLPQMNATELSMTLWALARLRLNPGHDWLDAAVLRGASLLMAMPLEGLTALVHSITWIPSYIPEAIIAYKSSELRAVELLDDLCNTMRDYALVSPTGKKTKFWLKVKGEGSNATMLSAVTRPPRPEEEAKSKRLEAYCGVMLEELEEELYAGIMKGGFDTQGVESLLCRGIVSACPVPAAVAEPSDAEAAGEVVAEEEDGEQEGEAAEGAEGASAATGSAGSETRYIDNMKVEVGPDGKFEL
ncbi:hypothetical protein GPECTOR_9g503 [Gonium pectorale]|uniref:DUF3456 domain-containing protein n=1 Tax=Gonium pectorale TaxID=33097 RepID=A0A150GRJ7_GONPE|nr:hypothetical protein GPECTOR_9g503 [Gonium pectorale]|eukprot:KXZ52459.1 hypothetical protein GPECTOR_9g503 [Gonium pectorale]